MATGTIIKDTPVSGNGYYKMPDGTLIQWGKINISNVAIDKTWGQLYESAKVTADQDFPVKFTAEPCLTALSYTNPTSFVESISFDNERINSYYLLRGTSATVSGHIHWQAIGRWK